MLQKTNIVNDADMKAVLSTRSAETVINNKPAEIVMQSSGFETVYCT